MNANETRVFNVAPYIFVNKHLKEWVRLRFG